MRHYVRLWLDEKLMKSLMKLDGSEEELNDLSDLLSGFGINFEIETLTEEDGKGEIMYALFTYDDLEVEERRTRNAGRRSKTPSIDSPLRSLDAAHALEWLDSHTVEEGMEALGGVSRAVYYRRKKSLKQIRDDDSTETLWMYR